MKKIFCLHMLALCICTGAFSQYVLKTPDRKTVKLNENGTVEETTRQQYMDAGEIKSFRLQVDSINNMEKATFDMDLLSNGIIYQYRGIVLSSPNGSFQFIVGTQKEVFDEDRSRIMDLLNGIVKLK